MAYLSFFQTIKYPVDVAGYQKSSNQQWRDFVTTNDFCLTGDGLVFLNKSHPTLFQKILPHVKIFARVAPKQKEFVITG